MEAVIFCGIPGSGKSTFYKERFFRTHLRISMDLLNTRNKESQFLQTCLQTQQRFVVDNTNPEAADRRRYIDLARQHKFSVTGFYFQSKLEDALRRNSGRSGKELVSGAGIRSVYSRLQVPEIGEGFDQLFYVEIAADGFAVKNWKDEI